MENKIILIGGYPGAGKSTFSRELARRIGVPCFNKDMVKETIAEGFGIENAEFVNKDKKGSSTTFKLLLHIAESFLYAGSTCILESNFQVLYPKPVSESEQIRILLAKYDCQCITFNFLGDLNIISRRYFQRDKSGERHWIHDTAANEDSIKNYCIAAKLDEFAIGETISVDATAFDKIDYDILFDAARRFMIK
ncbi:MAG: AAA family ATPase [Defluviitaleaceae bacterium]|nr:AAA family ATPase [Defluviitaleaceae bacterium]